MNHFDLRDILKGEIMMILIGSQIFENFEFLGYDLQLEMKIKFFGEFHVILPIFIKNKLKHSITYLNYCFIDALITASQLVIKAFP